MQCCVFYDQFADRKQINVTNVIISLVFTQKNAQCTRLLWA
ncbi:hypothetical protein PCIT_a2618 [Pseudoalteromonas citrea]|uniref:Uncharacterized protein n=1 Tax=Pseudoalteromonas citrea TaxID=43655 RepID=A0AAD4AHB2_9GAMM|nr:hypothetical protein PCIT_a2618 [Pseudoalteromonas citrea]